MPKKVGPYIGVTGFSTRTQVEFALESIPHESIHRLMVGVLMSAKTLRGETNKWPRRYPRKEEVAGIFVDDPRALNLIHYSTDDPSMLSEQLHEIGSIAGRAFDGFQLNIAWPSVEELKKYRVSEPDAFIVLQIGRGAMVDEVNELANKVQAYQGLIDALLIDPSGGKGELFDTDYAVTLLRSIEKLPIFGTIGIGIAGGLEPDTLHHLHPIVRSFPSVSIDAEGRLRDSNDEINLARVRVYLEDSLVILSGKELPGTRLRKFDAPYGFDIHAVRYGSGSNMLRTSRLSQPGALEVGDILATGDKVLSPPREGGNGSVLLHVTGGFDGHWIGVPARIPIALLTKDDNAPFAVWKHSEK